MALWDEVTARYPNDELVGLTAKGDRTITSVDATQGGRAATAAQAQFETYAEQDYDSTDQTHIECAVLGVIAILQSWGGTSNSVAKIALEDWRESCRAIRNTTSRARIEPTSPQVLDTSGRVVEPWARDEHWAGLIGSESTEDD